MQPKPGIKTTEFWITLGVSIATVAGAHFEQVDGTVGTIAVAALTALYTILRAAIKSSAAKQ